jgi:hypothetical protein
MRIWQKHFINEYIDNLFSLGIEKTQSIMGKIKEKYLPKYLYKFFPPTTFSLINLQNNQFYLSNPREFNDPFDSYVCIEQDTYIKRFILKKLKQKKLVSKHNSCDSISEKEYWEIYNSNSQDERYISNRIWPYKKSFQSTLYNICQNKSETLKNYIKSLQVQAFRECSKKIKYLREMPFKITCFSNFDSDNELGANTTMWSHYAYNHEGFCVKYSINFEVDNFFKDMILCGLFPVIYTSKVSKIPINELIKLKFSDKDMKLTKPILKAVLKALITKSRFWHYEKEWRLIIGYYDNEIIFNNTIPAFKVKSIYLGCRIKDDLKKVLIKFAESNNISIFQAKQNDERFELDFYQLSSKTIQEEEFYDKLKKYNKITDQSRRYKYILNLYN